MKVSEIIEEIKTGKVLTYSAGGFSKMRYFTISFTDRQRFLLSCNNLKRKQVLPLKDVENIISNIFEDNTHFTIN